MKVRLSNKSRGMTLIEIIVVIALVGLLLSLGVTVLTDWFDDNLSKTASELSGTIKYAYNESAIKNRIYRLKIDFTTQTISIEAASEEVKIDNALEEESVENKDSSQDFPPAEDASNPAKKENFASASTYLLKPIHLPDGIKIKDVYVEHAGKKIDNGMTAIYFFPNGWVEKAIINLCDEKEEIFYSIEIHSFTGKSTIRHEYLDYQQVIRK